MRTFGQDLSQPLSDGVASIMIDDMDEDSGN